MDLLLIVTVTVTSLGTFYSYGLIRNESQVQLIMFRAWLEGKPQR